MTPSRKKTLKTYALLISASLLMTACASTGSTSNDRTAKIDAVMERAAHNARTNGQTEQSLTLLEQLYKRNSSAENALKYAHALRQEGYFNRASLVLGPFAEDSNNKNADISIEYAAIMAAMGEYVQAEEAARQAVTLQPESGRAYHLLGIALDAQGHHEPAQVAFDKGLEHWEGDPSPILNNMGLNLAALGFLDEAIETLRKALDTAPNRKEIERNLRIVTALQYQPPTEGSRLVPKPPRKPEWEAKSAVRPIPGTAEAPIEKSEMEAVAVEEVEATALDEE